MDGIAWFTYHTIGYMVRNNPDIHFYLLFDTDPDPEFIFGPNVTPIKLFPPAKHAVLNLMWFEVSVRMVLVRVKPDLFLSTDGLLCLGWNGPQFGVIHDINYVHFPKDLKFSNRTFFNNFYPRYARKATHLATVSEYSKADIVKEFHIPPGKIDIVYSGLNSGFVPFDEEQKKAVRQKYSQGKPYFVFVGTLHPRKNVYKLMQGFEEFKKAVPSDVKLILAGWEMYRTNELHELHATMSSKDDVIFTGRVPGKDINGLIAAAECLTFVPYFEGFGLPPLEAMSCHVPVIASNVTSIPEVVGDAAISVDPHNIDQIKDAMIAIHSSPSLRNELITKGIERIKTFTWERTARLLNESVQCTLAKL